MSKIEEIYLHVGIHKTGTSSIQDTLFSNMGILKKYGYMYPAKWQPNHSFIMYSLFDENPEKFHVGCDCRKIKEINEKYLNDLESELVKGQKLIISAESISSMTVNSLQKLKEYLLSISKKVNVIIYLRNHIAWATSVYQQRIKQSGDSHDKAFELVKKVIKNPFRGYIFKFSKVFGHESLNIYSFEDAIKHKNEIVGHFLTMIGLNKNNIERFEYVRSNDSISVISTDIIAYINEMLPLFNNNEINNGRYHGDIDPILNISGPKFNLSYIDKKTLLEICANDIEWLKNAYKIDYSDTDLVSNSIEYYLTDEIIHDIKTAYTKLCPSLKAMLLEYLQKRIVFSSNHDRAMLRSLLEELKT